MRLLREMAESGDKGRGDQKTGSQATTPKLSDLGITKTPAEFECGAGTANAASVLRPRAPLTGRLCRAS